jgi:hypothetical protein
MRGHMEIDNELQLYLDIKKEFYRANEQVLKNHGVNWSKFYKLEEGIKRDYKGEAPGVIYLNDGYSAEVVTKPITMYEGKGKIIGVEISHISIHKDKQQKEQ